MREATGEHDAVDLRRQRGRPVIDEQHALAQRFERATELALAIGAGKPKTGDGHARRLLVRCPAACILPPSMPKIVFEASEAGPAMTVDEPSGGRLVDICDDASAPVPFSCRGASCATCRIQVLEGADLFEPPDHFERELLEEMGEPGDRRLACSAKIRGGAGLVRLRSVDD